MPKVSVLISSFRPGGIDVSLEGMKDQTFKDFEVIFVDRRYERRHERVTALAAQYGLDLYHVPEHRRNGKWVGIGSAWNTAMAVANGDVLIFLPDWTYAPPGWIEAHLERRGDDLMAYVVCPYRHTRLPELRLKQPCDFTNQHDRCRVCTDVDAVLAGDVFDEVSAFAELFTGAVALALQHYPADFNQDTRVAGPGAALHHTWVHLKNESISRALAYKINGLDERLDRGKGPLDTDWAFRIYAAGGRSAWEPKGMAFTPDPRWICGSMPWGSKDERVEGRWSYWDGNAYNERRIQEASYRRDFRAKNPFDLRDLRADLLARGWRDKTKVIDVKSLDVDDRTYYGAEIWPETP